MNVEDDTTCPVCLEPVVCPYSLGCGHTLDARCFIQLKKKECPQCRFSLKHHDIKKYGVNLMLQKLLREKVPNYDQLQQEQMKFVKSVGLLKAYRASARYAHCRRLIEEYIQDHCCACPLSDLITHIKSTEPDSELEIRYILDQSDRRHTYLQLDVDDQPYVVDSDEDNLALAFGSLRGRISENNVIQMIATSMSITSTVERCGLKLRNRPFLTEQEKLIDHLISLGDKAIEKDSGAEADADADSEWSTVSDADADSDSDSDNDIGLSIHIRRRR